MVLVNLIPRVSYLLGSVQLFFEKWTVQYLIDIIYIMVAKLSLMSGAHTDDKHPFSASHHTIITPKSNTTRRSGE